MAFQNSTGGIVLDATLTDLGRKYMAQGKFKIVKFALGDDEIDYSLAIRDASSSSGEEVSIPAGKLPPILEAFGSQNANIVYGLLNLPRPDILYIPTLKINDKLTDSVAVHSDGYHYLAVNNETKRKVESDLGTNKQVLEQGTFEKNKLYIESGIIAPEQSSDDLFPTEHNKNAYILNLGLY